VRSVTALEEGFDLKRRIDERGDSRGFIGARYAELWQHHLTFVDVTLSQVAGSRLAVRISAA
jgi:hypothetical protein